MKKKNQFLTLATVGTLLLANIVAAQEKSFVTLKVGDPAPPITYKKWIKGTPVEALEKGKVYVLEFWATWCSPCRTAMPHLSKIANKYDGKATVLSFNVRELQYKKENADYNNIDYIGKVERFVKAAGKVMDYSVAIDDPQGTMWKTWVAASGGNGIPYALIVDRNSTIAWIGSVKAMDEVLDLVINDAYTPEAAKKLADARRERRAPYPELFAKFNSLKEGRMKDYQKAAELADELIEVNPMVKEYIMQEKYKVFVRLDPAKAAAFGEELLKEYQNNPTELAALANAIFELAQYAEVKADLPLALRAMQQAYSFSDEGDFNLMKILAEAYYRNGNAAKAVELQTKALSIMKKAEFADFRPEYIEQDTKTLEKYTASLTAKG